MNRTHFRRWILVALALVAGSALRLWFIRNYPVIEGDPLVYGDIAKNWLLHGVYGLSGESGIHPTLIRLPGYPLFLVGCFKVFGMEHYGAVMYLQVAIDLASCLLIAGFALRIYGTRAAMIALWLACACPFLADYVAAPLTETLSIFCVALAIYALARLIDGPSAVAWLLLLGLSLGYATLLRPDGALLAVVLCPAIVAYGRKRWGMARALRLAMTCGLLAVLPFVPWTIRNWRTFHVFSPLAPRYAVDPGESATPGFNRWMKTWCVEFTSTFEVYWNANTDRLDVGALPARAYDSAAQQKETAALFSDYNQGLTLTPALDARFASLAEERIHGHLLRYYLELPLLRVSDMWLRPRTESLPIELRWWQYGEHPAETRFAIAYAALNLLYLLAALAGLMRWPRFAGAMLAFIVFRSVLLATLEAPEPRYTLECFPMVIALAAIALTRRQLLGERFEQACHSKPN